MIQKILCRERNIRRRPYLQVGLQGKQGCQIGGEWGEYARKRHRYFYRFPLTLPLSILPALSEEKMMSITPVLLTFCFRAGE